MIVVKGLWPVTIAATHASVGLGHKVTILEFGTRIEDERQVLVARMPACDPSVWIVLGRYSHAIYMIHQLVSGLLHGWILKQEPLIRGWQGSLTTLAALLATFALAWLSFRFLESPFLRLGQRFR